MLVAMDRWAASYETSREYYFVGWSAKLQDRLPKWREKETPAFVNFSCDALTILQHTLIYFDYYIECLTLKFALFQHQSNLTLTACNTSNQFRFCPETNTQLLLRKLSL